MKLEAITAAQKLLELKLITDQQFADLVVKSLNGHAATAVQQQLPLIKPRKRVNTLGLEQMGAVVEMHLMGQPAQVIADTINVRYQVKLSKGGVEQIIQEIRSGHKARRQRYQSSQWQTALAAWKQALLA